MCGRFTMHHSGNEIADRFGVATVETTETPQTVLFHPLPRYNLAPTQTVAVITTGVSPTTNRRERFLEGYQWGLIPAWAKDTSIGSKLINARAETVAEKPSFKNALLHRRCLIPADGFYEWDKSTKPPQPIYYRRRDGGLFAFAGLWEEWRQPDGSPLRTCTIITTNANQTVGAIHDRMPAILLPGDEAHWLSPPDTNASPPDLGLLHPYPDSEMVAVAVSRRVNTPVNDDAALIAPVGG